MDTSEALKLKQRAKELLDLVKYEGFPKSEKPSVVQATEVLERVISVLSPDTEDKGLVEMCLLVIGDWLDDQKGRVRMEEEAAELLEPLHDFVLEVSQFWFEGGVKPNRIVQAYRALTGVLAHNYIEPITDELLRIRKAVKTLQEWHADLKDRDVDQYAPFSLKLKEEAV